MLWMWVIDHIMSRAPLLAELSKEEGEKINRSTSQKKRGVKVSECLCTWRVQKESLVWEPVLPTGSTSLISSVLVGTAHKQTSKQTNLHMVVIAITALFELLESIGEKSVFTCLASHPAQTTSWRDGGLSSGLHSTKQSMFHPGWLTGAIIGKDKPALFHHRSWVMPAILGSCRPRGQRGRSSNWVSSAGGHHILN